MLRIFEMVILNTKWKDCKSRKKRLGTQNWRRKFIKHLFPEKRRENMQPKQPRFKSRFNKIE